MTGPVEEFDPDTPIYNRLVYDFMLKEELENPPVWLSFEDTSWFYYHPDSGWFQNVKTYQPREEYL